MSQQKESGFVSIITAILLMVVLSLITLGFTRLMQREQRQALDRQLSRTALYAAESGVNDVIAAINSGTAGYNTSAKTTCTPGAIPSANLSGDNSVAVTCAMYDNIPGTLEYDISSDNSKIVEMKTASGSNFTRFTIRFGQQSGPNDLTALPTCNTPNTGDFPTSRPNSPPLLRLDLTSVSTPYNRASLIQNTDYMYIAPCNDSFSLGTLTQAFSATTRGSVVEARCSGATSQPCEVHINTLIPASNTFFARMRPIYTDASVSIEALEDDGFGGNRDAKFLDAQISVDVTAKASDVIRRLRVSVPKSASVDVPEAVLQVFDGICKRVEYTPAPLGIVDQCAPGAATVTVCDLSNLPATLEVLETTYLLNPAAYTLPPCPGAPVPAGDGYAPVAAGGRLYNLFHHRTGAVVACYNYDLTKCGVRENAAFITSYSSNLVELGGRLYFTARQFPILGVNSFGMGCYDYSANAFCGFTPLGTTDFVSGMLPPRTVENSAAIGPIVELGGRLYTSAIDTTGNESIYCAELSSGLLTPCSGFLPYDIGTPVTPPNSLNFLVSSFNVQGTRLYFSTNAGTGKHLGCFDTATRNTCAGWATKTITPAEGNNAAVLIDNSLCVFNANINVQPTFFRVSCYSTVDGSSVARPANYLTQPMPANAVNGFWWTNFDPLYDGSRVYLSGWNFGPGGSVYCYDRATHDICAGWGGDGGWQDGSTASNDFSDTKVYDIVRVGACIYGAGDDPDASPTSLVSFSAADGSICP